MRDAATQPPHQRFATTRWTVVLAAAGDPAVPQTRDAMASLAQTYYLPLYSFIRRQGNSPPDAEDLTQEFVARLIEK
jgi:DNA-directed RNA polymerase specialized sigma24 family protein